MYPRPFAGAALAACEPALSCVLTTCTFFLSEPSRDLPAKGFPESSDPVAGERITWPAAIYPK
jgi:hypothetical protein